MGTAMDTGTGTDMDMDITIAIIKRLLKVLFRLKLQLKLQIRLLPKNRLQLPNERSGIAWRVTYTPCQEVQALEFMVANLINNPKNDHAAPGPFDPQADPTMDPGVPPSTAMPFAGGYTGGYPENESQGFPQDMPLAGDPGSGAASYGGWGENQEPAVAKGKTVDAIEENLYRAGKTTGVATAPALKVQNWAHHDSRFEKY
ncbi:hypothetical protein Daus18300_010142 [Diaporthe australafricana]|uniref:Uncharacterized protein n=1 Tax=Diaporthe australafricana TaxID=127596 RepID=A0ABR3WC44_9PEZI